MSKFAFGKGPPPDDDTADRVARVVHRTLKAAPPATSVNYKGESYNSMDNQHDAHSWLQRDKHDYKGDYVKALKKEGYKVREKAEKGAQLNEGTVPGGVTHHIEVSKGGRKAHIRHGVDTSKEAFPDADYHEIAVDSTKPKQTSGHPTDNFRNFLEDEGHMEPLKKLLKERFGKN